MKLKDKLQSAAASRRMQERQDEIARFRSREKYNIETAKNLIKTIKERCLEVASEGKITYFYQYQTNGSFKYPSSEPRNDYQKAFEIVVSAIKKEELNYSCTNVCETQAYINIYW